MGFRLVEDPTKISRKSVTSFMHYGGALYHAILEGTDDLQTREIANLINVDIPVDPSITAIKFDLTPQERETLFKSGVEAGERVLERPACRRLLDLI